MKLLPFNTEFLETFSDSEDRSIHRIRLPDQESELVLKRDRNVNRVSLLAEAQLGRDSGLYPHSDLVVWKGQVCLIRDFVQGTPFSRLAGAEGVGTTRFLDLAVSTVTALIRLHEKGILHRALNPTNVLLGPDATVHIVDLVLAARMPLKAEDYRNSLLTDWSLAYAAPEATGRMSRPQDHRTDYYSLGATFYHLLTGRAPFQATESLELIHQIFAQPIKPALEWLPQLPKVLSAILSKLLAKNPEDRYQSLSGLLNDLTLCRAQWRMLEKIEEFTPGRSDLAARLILSRKVYGREQARRDLAKAYEQTLQGHGGLFLIDGPSGIGKTLFAKNELKELAQSRGQIFEGNFQVLDLERPFHGWSQILDGIGRWILSSAPEVREQWLETAPLYLQGLERLLLPLVPSLEPFWTVVAPLAEIEGRDRNLRFKLAVKSFLQSLEHFADPLILFFDDLQWADSASLDLLQDLLLEERLNKVLYVATRQTSAGQPANSERPWARLLGKVVLGPFGAAECGLFLIDTLQVAEGEVQALATRLLPMSGGFPLLLGFLIQSSYEKGSLRFDALKNKWLWQLELLPPKPPGEDVLPVILESLFSQPPALRELLEAASALGLRFRLGELARHVGRSMGQVHRELWPVIQDGTLRPSKSDYQFEPEALADEGEDAEFLFSHPRIQSEIHRRLDPDERSRLHLALAREERSHPGKRPGSGNLHALARQFVLGFDALDPGLDHDDITQVLEEAGRVSMAESDFERAQQYLGKALELLKGDDDSPRHSRLVVHAAEASYLSHRAEEAFTALALNLARCSNPVERMRIQACWITLLHWDNRNTEAVKLVRTILAEHGHRLPQGNPLPRVILGSIATGALLPENQIAGLDRLPRLEDERLAGLFAILKASTPVFFFADLGTYPLLIFLMVKLTLTRGWRPESLIGLSSYAALLLGPLGKVRAGYRLAKQASHLVPTWSAQRFAGTSSFVELGFAAFRFESIVSLPEACTEAWKMAIRAGDMEYAGWNLYWSIVYRHFLGHDVQGLADETVALKEFQRHHGLRQQLPLTEFLLYQLRSLSRADVLEAALVGLPPTLKDLVEQAKIQGDNTILELAHVPRATALLWTGRYHEAWTVWSEVRRSLSPIPTFFSVDSIFLQCWSGLLAAATLPAASSERRQILKQVETFRKGVDLQASRNPGSLSWQVRLLEAERVSLGRQQWTESLWSPVFEDVLAAGFSRYAALVARLLGLRLADPARQAHWLSLSRDLFLAQGLQALVQETAAQRRPNGPSDRPTDLDTLTLAKASEALIQELRIDRLMEKIIHYAVENVGAQKAYFLLPQNGDWLVETSVDTTEPRTQWFQVVHLPWKDDDRLPHSVIQSCLSTGKAVILEDASRTAPFDSDPVIRRLGSRSVLCIPFLHHNKITGLLYLANDLTPGAFQADRIPILGLLASQIAVSLENAQLYSNLEAIVQERTLQLENEKKTSEELLLNILPSEIASELRTWGRSDARYFESVTVLFADIVDFTVYAAKTEPTRLIDELDHYFKAFDRLTEAHGIEKIKTIGDAYLCVGGLPSPTETHAQDTVTVALELLAWMEAERERRAALGLDWFRIRIGIHTGPVIAGVVGSRKFAYDIWGDTVNLAARLEQHSEPGRINISRSARDRLEGRYRLTDRGAIEAKNKGQVEMYFIEGARDN